MNHNKYIKFNPVSGCIQRKTNGWYKKRFIFPSARRGICFHKKTTIYSM